MEHVVFEVKKLLVGQDMLLERLIVALLARGHVLVEGVPGLAKTMAIKTMAQTIGGDFQRIQFTPDLVPADLIGTRIYNQRLGEFQTSLGPGAHQPAARRRDQPGTREGAERAARGDAGAAGHDRPRDAPRRRAVPRDGHPEPDRVRGHVPAARGAARPVHAQGARRLPDTDRGVRHRRADDDDDRSAEAGDGIRRAVADATSCRCRVRRSGADGVRGARRQRDPQPGIGRPARPRRLRHLRRQPARLDQHDPRRRRRWPSSAAATTRSPTTSPTSRSMCSATASCCRTRRWPTTSAPTPSSPV